MSIGESSERLELDAEDDLRNGRMFVVGTGKLSHAMTSSRDLDERVPPLAGPTTLLSHYMESEGN